MKEKERRWFGGEHGEEQRRHISEIKDSSRISRASCKIPYNTEWYPSFIKPFLALQLPALVLLKGAFSKVMPNKVPGSWVIWFPRKGSCCRDLVGSNDSWWRRTVRSGGQEMEDQQTVCGKEIYVGPRAMALWPTSWLEDSVGWAVETASASSRPGRKAS